MAVSVSEPAGRIQERREDQGVAIEDPRHRAEVGGVEGPTDIREGDIDDEQVQAGQKRRGGHHNYCRGRASGRWLRRRRHAASKIKSLTDRRTLAPPNAEYRTLYPA